MQRWYRKVQGCVVAGTGVCSLAVQEGTVNLYKRVQLLAVVQEDTGGYRSVYEGTVQSYSTGGYRRVQEGT